jgi:2-hydroxy-3-oxopropionate reductase
MDKSLGTVGVIGLGQMGRPMARALMRAGWQAVVWDLAATAADRLGSEGAIVARDPADVAQQASVVITSLPGIDAVRAVAFGDESLTSHGGRPELLVDMSTTTPGGARALAADLAPFGVSFLDAPVSGGASGAAAGTLTVMVGGAVEDLDRARPVLDSLARLIVHCGPAGAGQVAKACNQLIVMTALGAVAEALVLARRAGLDAAVVRQALLGGYAASPILEIQGDRMLRRDFAPGGRAAYNLKDIATIREMASGAELDLPVFEAAAQQMLRLINEGGADLDNAAVITVVEGAAGGRNPDRGRPDDE